MTCGAPALPVVAAAGKLSSAVGFIQLSGWDARVTEPVLSLDLALTGCGFGLVLSPLAGAALGAARGGSEAVAAAALTIARMIGMMVGLSALTTWGFGEFNRRVAQLSLPLPQAGQPAQVHQALLDRYEAGVTAAAVFVFDRLFLVAAILCALAALLTLWLSAKATGGRPSRYGSSPRVGSVTR